MHDYQRDGAMRFDGNAGSARIHEPNHRACLGADSRAAFAIDPDPPVD